MNVSRAVVYNKSRTQLDTGVSLHRDHRVPCGPPAMTLVDSAESLSDYVNTSRLETYIIFLRNRVYASNPKHNELFIQTTVLSDGTRPLALPTLRARVVACRARTSRACAPGPETAAQRVQIAQG
jgi:hypothetical protein